jgi:predicted nucleic acid-binding protein
VVYLDTSLLVAAFTDEPASEKADLLLGGLRGDEASISEWVITEFSAALSLKIRRREITQAHRDHALAHFRRMAVEAFRLVPVLSQHFRTAARFADQYQTGLRAGDALHLAIAADEGVTLCTLDRRQAEAGKALGVVTKLV